MTCQCDPSAGFERTVRVGDSLVVEPKGVDGLLVDVVVDRSLLVVHSTIVGEPEGRIAFDHAEAGRFRNLHADGEPNLATLPLQRYRVSGMPNATLGLLNPWPMVFRSRRRRTSEQRVSL